MEPELGSLTHPSNSLKGNLMNKDQVKGQAKKIAGKVQEASGKLMDSKPKALSFR